MPVLEIDGQKFEGEELVKKILEYGMMPRLIKEIILDHCTADIEITSEERDEALKYGREKKGINSEDKLELLLKETGLTKAQFDGLSEKFQKVKKFKQATWGKPNLDQVIYSQILTKDIGIAQELYYRIKGQEQSFEELAQKYSQGSEAQTGGKVGPHEFRVIDPTLQKILRASDIGQVQPPMTIDKWIVIVRLDQLIRATLDTDTQKKIIEEKYNRWLQESIIQQMISLLSGFNPKISDTF